MKLNLGKISNILIAVLIIITVVVTVMFAVGGELPGGSQYSTPIYTSTLLNWAYILLGIATISALIFPIIRLVSRPKQAVNTFIGLGILAAVIGVARAMADGTPLNLIGYTGPDNVPSALIFSDTIIFTMYFLLGGTVLAIVSTEIIRKFR